MEKPESCFDWEQTFRKKKQRCYFLLEIHLALKMHVSGKLRALRVYLPYSTLRYKLALKLTSRMRDL